MCFRTYNFLPHFCLAFFVSEFQIATMTKSLELAAIEQQNADDNFLKLLIEQKVNYILHNGVMIQYTNEYCSTFSSFRRNQKVHRCRFSNDMNRGRKKQPLTRYFS